MSNYDGPDQPFAANLVLERAQGQWLFAPSELKRTPSILDGMPFAQEQANRSKGVNFVTQVGILLKLPQLTLATASVYLHRFFTRHSMVDLPNRPGFHHYSVAATALFLASKVEENCRKMKELVVACCRVAQKQPNLVVDEQSKEYWKWRDTILHNEDFLLEALCFDLEIEQPYRILYDFLCYYKGQENKHLRNTSWAFLNDSHVTRMCLLFSPRTIAGAAFYAGARWAETSFPDDSEGRPWWDHLELDIFAIQQACSLMAEVYENSSLPRKNQETYFKDEDGAAAEKTRSPAMFIDEVSPAHSFGADSQGVKRNRDEFNRDSQGPQTGSVPVAIDTSNAKGDLVNGSRSPKRPRREDANGLPMDQGNSRIPIHHSLPPRPPPLAEDLQQRIDEIVKASEPSQPQPPRSLNGSNYHNSQSRSYSRRSSSTSTRGRPQSSNSHGPPNFTDGRSRSQQRPSYDASHRNEDRRAPPESRDQREAARPRSPRQRPKSADTVEDVVDYGSEEGEL